MWTASELRFKFSTAGGTVVHSAVRISIRWIAVVHVPWNSFSAPVTRAVSVLNDSKQYWIQDCNYGWFIGVHSARVVLQMRAIFFGLTACSNIIKSQACILADSILFFTSLHEICPNRLASLCLDTRMFRVYTCIDCATRLTECSDTLRVEFRLPCIS